jgi:hypothetical protein
MAQEPRPLADREPTPLYQNKVGFTILAVLCSPALFLPFSWVLVIGPTEVLIALGVPRAVVLVWFVLGIACSIGATVWVLRRVWRLLYSPPSGSPRE